MTCTARTQRTSYSISEDIIKTSLVLCVTYMEVGDVLSVQGLADRQLSGDRFNDEDAGGGLVSSRTRHTVSEGPVFVMVRPDLWVERRFNDSCKAMTAVRLHLLF